MCVSYIAYLDVIAGDLVTFKGHFNYWKTFRGQYLDKYNIEVIVELLLLLWY